MSGEENVGSIIGYLTLDASAYRQGLTDAGRQADELSRHSPSIRIQTNAPSAIAQLAAVAAAAKKLQDAQGALSVAEAKQTALAAKGNATAAQTAAADEKVASAHRAVESATVNLAAVHQKNADAMDRAGLAAERLSEKEDELAISSLKAKLATNQLGSEMDKAQPFAVNLWAALAAIAPAAVPIAGVVGGALVGLIPVAATLALGIKGISDEFQSGQLAAGPYGRDLASLQTWMTGLKTTAASGLLAGLDEAFQGAHPLFAEITGDVRDMSGEIGDIVGHAGPALLTIFTQMNPLFETFGNLLVRGATELETWTASSHGVQSFVAYVQAELPEVMQFLGNTAVLIAHIVEASAPFGGVVLGGFGLLVRVLDELPIGVLQVLIPLLTTGYAAVKAYQGAAAIGATFDAAMVRMGAAAEVNAVRQEAASTAVTAAKAQESAAFARDALAEGLAQQDAAAQIAASVAGTNSLLAESAAIYAETSAEGVASLRASALAADEWAAQTAADAQVAADALAASAGESSISMAAMLGPVGAVVVGVGILGATLLGTGGDAKQAATDQDGYTESVKKSTDALSAANVAQTVDALGKQHAYDQVDTLNKGISGLGLTYGQLTGAVNGSDAQFQATIKTLQDVSNYKYIDTVASKYQGAGYAQLAGASRSLMTTLTDQRKGLGLQIQDQLALQEATDQSAGSIDDQTEATVAQSVALGAATVNINGVTLAMSGQTTASDALATAIGILSGNANTLAEAQLSLDDSMSAITAQVKDQAKQYKDNGTSLSANTAEGRKNLEWVHQQIDAINNVVTLGQKNGSTIDQVTAKMKTNEQALISHAVKAGLDEAAVKKLLARYGLTPAEVKTAMLADTTRASQQIYALQQQINNIRQDKVPGILADTDLAAQQIAKLQAEIDGLSGKTVPIAITEEAVNGGHRNGPSASAPFVGPLPGSAAGTGSTGLPQGWSTVGERGFELAYTAGGKTQIVSHPQSAAIMGTAKLPGFAGGTGGVTFAGVKYASQASADNAITRSVDALAKDIETFGGSLTGSASTISSASATLIAAAKAAGASQKELTSAEGVRTALLRDANARDALQARLGSAPTAPTAFDALSTAQSNFASEKGTVQAAITGSFDVTTAGANPVTGQITGASLLAQDAQAVNNAKTFVRDYNLLKSKIPGPYLQQIAEKGPSALPELQALLSLSPAEDKTLAADNRSLVASAASLGTTVATQFDGGAVKAAQANVKALQNQIKSLSKTIDTLGDRLEGITGDIHLVATVNGKTLLTAVKTAERVGAR